ncbi:uncharacterized protein [Pseudorasbora parva]|uniref:uncharacterized protein n=1 Tax=Pseudorasbora parva TaxID=51549 RepID=UPI00351E6E91
MTALVLCAVLLCLSGCLSSTEAATGLNTVRPKTKCEQERDGGSGLIGAFVPRCDKDGQYEREQCHGSTGYCWCVDSTGQERPGTITPPGTPSINCEEPFRPKTKCEQERDGGSGLIGAFVPRCDKDGQYKREQCHGSTGYCWCVDSTGQERPGTITPPGTPSINCEEPVRPKTKCEQERDGGSGLIGAFVPRCDKDGQYEREQCHGSTGYCWCVDSTGQERPGTQTRPGNPRPRLNCKEPAKPGVCPSKRYTPKECDMIRYVMAPKTCTDDSDCVKKNEKCCSNGCIRQCTAPAPAPVNPGVCPSRRYTPGKCAVIRFVSCTNDSDCSKKEKCCSNGCGLQCMAPVTVNPGVCPSRRYTPEKCAVISFVSCTNDSDCSKKEKCCSNGCGLQCMAPVTVNPGVCPSRRYTPEKCAVIRFVSCTNDSDCSKKEKCCSNGCGLQCMAPVTV